MALPQKKTEEYTYADLLRWDTEIRYELYDGYPVALASPSDVHQEIVAGLTAQIFSFLRGKPCKLYPAPLDVRLFAQEGDRPEDVDTVVQPDLLVVCDREKVDSRGVHGAPDFVIEVLSPSTERYDRFTKFNLYRKAGVREYWVVSPESRMVQTFLLEGGQYVAYAYSEADRVPVRVLEGLEIDLSAVFPAEEEEQTS